VVLDHIILEIARKYPQQALWPILALANSKQEARATKGREFIGQLRIAAKDRTGSAATIVRDLLSPGSKLIKAMTDLCYDVPLEKGAERQLSKDFNFDKSVFPSNLVVPVHSMMTASLPSIPEGMKEHDPFPGPITMISMCI
jgi:serine/threonine-protein kinase ATR